MFRLFRCFWVLLVLLLGFGERGIGALRLEATAGGTDAAPGKTTRFSLANARGDVTTQVDAAGNITWQASYEAFGTRERGDNLDAQRANGLSRATAYQCTLRAVFLHRFAEGGSKDEDPPVRRQLYLRTDDN